MYRVQTKRVFIEIGADICLHTVHPVEGHYKRRVRSCAGTPPSGTGAHVQQRVSLNPIIHGPFRGSFHLVERAFPTPMDYRTSRLMTPTWRGPPCWSRTWRPLSTKTPSFIRIEPISSRGDDSANRTAPGYGPRRSPRWCVEKSRVFPLPAAVLLLA